MIDDYDVKMINPMYGQIKDKTSIPVIIHRICTDGIEFSDGTLMQSFHPRGCSEVHFADWPALSLYNINPLNGDKISVYDLKFSMFMEQMIQQVDNMGFNLVAIDGSKYFVPCYGCNNGYYSMDITLIIGKQGETGKILGLTNCQKIFDADYNVFERALDLSKKNGSNELDKLRE